MNSLGFSKKESETKVIVAMSGGVDSSVAAAMLKKQGYNVTGITLKLYNQTNKNSPKSCCAGIDIQDAINVSKQYDFPHHILDYQDRFFSNVIDDFVESYSDGRTPVPCIKCNQTVKFTDLLQEARNLNADTLVTGHYVRRIGDRNNAKLYKAKDSKKDQSYFLFATTKEQLDYLRFPIGEFFKSEIRNIANELSLKVKDKPDSQDICFVTNNSYRTLINNLKPESFVNGDIVNVNGEIIGEHKGIVNYTVGQRKGIGLGGYNKPLYVIQVNKEKNQIVLGEKKFLEKTILELENVNWLENFKINDFKCSARIRSNQEEKSGTIKIINNKINFLFDEKIFSTSPGQACVFYLDKQVLGGGWISKMSD